MAKRTKASKKAAVKTGRKQCAEPGCRKHRLLSEDFSGDFCAAHAQKAGEAKATTTFGAPGDNGMPEESRRLSELDLLRFVRADTELHNHTLEIKNLEQEHLLDETAFSQRRTVRGNRIKLLQQSIRQRQVAQKAFLAELGGKYGFDYTITSIDDQTGVIHEHPQKGE